MTDCQHETFRAAVDVFRLSDRDDGPITHYSADVHIWCVQCGEPFVFVGVPMGISPTHPTSSVDGHKLRVPIMPKNVHVREPQSKFNPIFVTGMTVND